MLMWTPQPQDQTPSTPINRLGVQGLAGGLPVSAGPRREQAGVLGAGVGLRAGSPGPGVRVLGSVLGSGPRVRSWGQESSLEDGGRAAPCWRSVHTWLQHRIPEDPIQEAEAIETGPDSSSAPCPAGLLLHHHRPLPFDFLGQLPQERKAWGKL